MGTLYLVATPIGNLGDMSPRALRILREACLIAAEDTRLTRKLLAHFDIHTPLTSYYEHNKLGKLESILDTLVNGDVALVSDAGMPGLNDPGYELVRAAVEAGCNVSPVPGPSAPVAALAASGLPTDSFLYLGFLPRKTSERRELVRRINNSPYTLIFLEAPHRLLDSLADLESILGARQIAVARELTKVHEEIWRGTIPAAREHFTQNEPRGEFTLVVAGKKVEVERWTEEKVVKAIISNLKLGESPTKFSAHLAAESGWSRREIYKLAALVKERIL